MYRYTQAQAALVYAVPMQCTSAISACRFYFRGPYCGLCGCCRRRPKGRRCRARMSMGLAALVEVADYVIGLESASTR
eukprot:scaffold31868_cov114-Isochrysis_galbana.AAC.2